MPKGQQRDRVAIKGDVAKKKAFNVKPKVERTYTNKHTHAVLSLSHTRTHLSTRDRRRNRSWNPTLGNDNAQC